MKNEHKKSDMTFYSARGILLMLVAVLIFATLALIGMYALGVIRVPNFILNIINAPVETSAPPLAANIAPESDATEIYEALPREEYANALSDIVIPNEYYHNYTVTWLYGDSSHAVDYIAIYRDGDWWVQTEENDVIMSTTVCKDGIIQLSDNADNTSASISAKDISFVEYFGYLPLKNLIAIIHSLTNGENVSYGGGVSDYSLSFTQARGTSENIFSFSFTRSDGISEEYTFAFESATILAASKYNAYGEKIYQMEMKDSRNDLTDIDVDSLIVISEND